MLLAVEAGFQAALMAPTQILAEQHYRFLRRWLEPLGVRDRLANSGPAGRKLSSPARRREQSPQIFVGTHALLYEPEGLERPGLVVIDEQHKFGVAQRGSPNELRAGPGCSGHDRDANSAHPDDESLW